MQPSQTKLGPRQVHEDADLQTRGRGSSADNFGGAEVIVLAAV